MVISQEAGFQTSLLTDWWRNSRIKAFCTV